MQMSIKGKIIQIAEEKGGWGVSKKKKTASSAWLSPLVSNLIMITVSRSTADWFKDDIENRNLTQRYHITLCYL